MIACAQYCFRHMLKSYIETNIILLCFRHSWSHFLLNSAIARVSCRLLWVLLYTVPLISSTSFLNVEKLANAYSILPQIAFYLAGWPYSTRIWPTTGWLASSVATTSCICWPDLTSSYLGMACSWLVDQPLLLLPAPIDRRSENRRESRLSDWKK